MILGLHHAAIAVKNLEEAVAFYCGVVGFDVVMEAALPSGIGVMADALGLADSEFKVRMIKKGNSCIEMFEFAKALPGDSQRPANKLGITHIALASDCIEDDYEMLSENGVVFNAPLFGAPPSRFAYGRDPFDNIIELLEHNPEAADCLEF